MIRRTLAVVVAAVALASVLAVVPAGATAERPPTVWRPIPFPHHRKVETARYSHRHYGLHRWRLIDPQVIVEHYTGSNDVGSTISFFSSDAPHLGELPNVCAQFVIDRDGTIYQVVSLNKICRHTIGLNSTAIGIEHVGTSDAQILGRTRQMRSSLRLTAWLMQTYGISIGNVIGHAESLTSPFYMERVAAYRCMTHSDWLHRDMKTYRRRLADVLGRDGVPEGTPYSPVDNGC